MKWSELDIPLRLAVGMQGRRGRPAGPQRQACRDESFRRGWRLQLTAIAGCPSQPQVLDSVLLFHPDLVPPIL